MAELTVSKLMRYIDQSIWSDYAICILITSASEGRIPSDGFDYGVGKSTLMLQIAYVFTYKYGKCTYQQAWDKVFSSLISFPWEFEYFFLTAPPRYPGDPVFILVDDMQLCFGKDRSRDPYIRRLRNRLTIGRPQFAVLMATAPDIGELARPFRDIWNFEIKVPTRGIYEVQRLKKWTDFRDPYTTKVTMPKEDWGLGARIEDGKIRPAFDDLDPEIKERYRKWRNERDKRYDQGEGDIRLFAIRSVLTEEAKKLLKAIIDKGSYTRQQIITNMELGMEMKLLQHCGLIQIFGDIVVPTVQARKLIKVL